MNQIALQMPEYEGNHGRFCIVEGELKYVDISGGEFEYTLDDPIQTALIKRYVHTIAERNHSTYGSALEYVKQQISNLL